MAKLCGGVQIWFVVKTLLLRDRIGEVNNMEMSGGLTAIIIVICFSSVISFNLKLRRLNINHRATADLQQHSLLCRTVCVWAN